MGRKIWDACLTHENDPCGGRPTLSHDGKLAVLQKSGKLAVFETETGGEVGALDVSAVPAQAAISRDGQMVAVETQAISPTASAMVSTGVHVFRVSDGHEIAYHPAPNPGPTCGEQAVADCGIGGKIIWDPNGRFIVFTEGVHSAKVWNPFKLSADGASIFQRYNGAGTLSLSPDGALLASGDAGSGENAAHIVVYRLKTVR